MTLWQHILKKSITHPRDLPQEFCKDISVLNNVVDRYPMRINPYYLDLMRKIGKPLELQALPDEKELLDNVCMEDPLNEENLSPVRNLIHKYPDRVLFLVHSQCAMYCRFCTRKRKVGRHAMDISEETIQSGLEYLRNTPGVRDVLISGGDPLLLSDEKLDWLLSSLRAIKHIEIIRIGSRVPCVLPMRVTKKLVAILKKYHPLYLNTHFNHPGEITDESTKACARLADAGIPLGCQTVLLKGVNDTPQIMKELMRGLLRIRVKPYYLFQGDMTKGTDHFRTKVETGIAIMKNLIGYTSGMAVPVFAVDAPGGGGKIPLGPDYVRKLDKNLVFSNYCGKTYTYVNGY
jgi:lysine 2,3-aminomutase